MVLLGDKRKFNAVSQNIKYGYIRRKTGKCSVKLAFVKISKLLTYLRMHTAG